MKSKSKLAANRAGLTNKSIGQVVEHYRGKRRIDFRRFSFKADPDVVAILDKGTAQVVRATGLRAWQARGAFIALALRLFAKDDGNALVPGAL